MNILSFLAEHFDLPVLEWIAENLHCPFLDRLFPIITMLGDAGIFWIAIAVVLMFLPKYRKTGIAMGGALLMGVVLCNLILKPWVARMRPFDYQLEFFNKQISLLIATPHDYSFPSGHTIASFEGAGVLLLNHKKLGIPAMILASLIAFSRLYLYVHYPTDVLASVILGFGLAILANWLTNSVHRTLQNRKKA